MTRDKYETAASAAVSSLIRTAEQYPCDATKLVAIITVQAYQRIGIMTNGNAARLIRYVERLG